MNLLRRGFGPVALPVPGVRMSLLLSLVRPERRNYMLFWNSKRQVLNPWYECVKVVALLQPSSAAAERVFAILRKQFSKYQDSTLEDYKGGSIKLRYNKIHRLGSQKTLTECNDLVLASYG